MFKVEMNVPEEWTHSGITSDDVILAATRVKQ